MHRAKLSNRRVDPWFLEPFNAFGSKVDVAKRWPKSLLQQHVALRPALAVIARLLIAPNQRLPTKRREQREQWSLDQLPFGP
jgi:hypothetical protein